MTNRVHTLTRRGTDQRRGNLLRQAWLVLTFLALLTAGLAGPARAQNAAFKDEELDQMLAPIALYPDSLLSQILMASTYPVDVKAAAAWSKAHPDAKGDDAVTKIESEPWEPSVKSLVAFPQVLAMMDAKPDDVQRLGDAFLADPARVMDRVQFLRKKAQEAGNLKTTEQQKVSSQVDEGKQVIVIEPAQPQTVYVPVYQPTVVYGPWWYPHYPPYYWPPPPYYYPGAAFVGGVIWGAAIVGIHNSLWGGVRWGRGDVNINVNRYNNINVNNRISANSNTFKHNPERRGDVPYRDNRSREQFANREAAGAKDREAYRGKDSRDADRARAEQAMRDRGVDPAAGREKLQGADRDRATQAVRATDRAGVGGDRAAAGGDRAAAGGDRAAAGRDRAAAGADRAAPSNRAGAAPSGAFSDVRDSGASRAAAERGASSSQSMARQGGGTPSRSASPGPSRSASPAPRGGGGARGGGGGARGGGGRR
jgi:hypothetical protein